MNNIITLPGGLLPSRREMLEYLKNRGVSKKSILKRVIATELNLSVELLKEIEEVYAEQRLLIAS